MTSLNRNALIELFPNEELEKLTEIFLGWKNIYKIEKNTFENLTNLIKLELNNNNLEELDPNIFDDLLDLKELRLDGNKLKQLNDKTLNGTKMLRQIYLNNNQLKEITSELFSQLTELKIIRLKNNGLQRIDKDAFKNLIKLEELSFRDNQIAELDNELFFSNVNLSELYMYNNKIKKLPSDLLRNLRKLTVLEINSNEIVEIPAGFFSNQALLRMLKLSNNKLKRIDSNIFEGLYNLEFLSLNNNRIIDIDKSAFFCLSKLKLLQLNDNKLRKVDPNCFSCLKSIEAIQLYDNYMPEIQCFDNSSGQLISDSLRQRKNYRFLSNWEQFLQQFYELNINQSDSDLTVRNIEDPYIGKILKTRYEIVSKLGKGSFGNVYLVKDLNHGVNKAIKIMDKLDISTLNEQNILWKVHHENLIKYYDHFDLNTSTRSYMCLVTEYCDNGDLKRQIKKAKESNRHFTDDEILNWMCQATNALKFLHSNDIIHRDIKPENMLLTKENILKLADLGIAKLIGSSTANTCVGTLYYMSPEIFESQFKSKPYNSNTDIWSLGCVLYELIFLELAFPQGQKNSPPVPHFNSSIFSSILSKMLLKDPDQRIDSNSLHDLLENMK